METAYKIVFWAFVVISCGAAGMFFRERRKLKRSKFRIDIMHHRWNMVLFAVMFFAMLVLTYITHIFEYGGC